MQGNDRAQTMSEQSSPISQTASAFYDPASSSWRTCQGSLLSEAPPSLQHLPPCATTVDGWLYEQATPEHLTGVRDGSASPNLPTPRSFLAHMYGRALPTTETRQNFQANLEEVIALLPTPTVQDGANNAGPSQWERNSKPLNVVAVELTMGLTGTLSNDGNGSSDDQHPTQPTAEDCDPSSSSG